MKREPLRTCVGCGRRDAQPRMIRLQLGGRGVLSAVGRAQAGRSAYLHDAPACIDALAKSRSLRRSLRADVAREVRLECAERIRAGRARVQIVEGAIRS